MITKITIEQEGSKVVRSFNFEDVNSCEMGERVEDMIETLESQYNGEFDVKECQVCGETKKSSPTPDGDEICPSCGHREMMDKEDTLGDAFFEKADNEALIHKEQQCMKKN